MNEIKLREATKKDWVGMHKIMNSEFQKHFNEGWTLSGAKKTFEYFKSIKSKIIVSVIEEEIAGFIIFRTEYYNDRKSIMIEELVVNSKYQRKGVGRKLVEKVELFAKRNEVKRILLTTGKNTIAFKFYKKLGFTDSKKTVLMRKLVK